MSWLKEVEDSVKSKERKIEEAEAAKRQADERDYQWKRREWSEEGFDLLKRWQEWNCDGLLKDLRDLLWPKSRVSDRRVNIHSIKGEDITFIEIKKEIQQKGLFGSGKMPKIVKRWRYNDHEIDDIAEFLSHKGIGPRDVADFKVVRSVYHSVLTYSGESDYYDYPDDFVLSLHKDNVVVSRDDETGHPAEKVVLEGITDLASLQEGIVQYLKTRPDLKDRLDIDLTQSESS